MKLKLLAAAAIVAVSGAANAAIDNGQATGNGELFLTMWDMDGQSYIRGLGMSIDSFASALSAPGSFSFNLNADPLFTSFLGSANLDNLVWNIQATDTLGERRMIQTYSGELPTGFVAQSTGSAAANIGNFLLDVNAVMGDANSLVVNNGSPAHGNTRGTNVNNTLPFNNNGTLANNSFASGLNLLQLRVAAAGPANRPVTVTPYLDEGFAVRAYFEPTGNLVIAAVPEPETFAMLLAGLGLMGAIARRRSKQA